MTAYAFIIGEEIYGSAKDFLSEQGRKTAEALTLQMKKDNKTQSSFVNAFDALFKQCKALQEAGKKGSIRYIYILEKGIQVYPAAEVDA